MASTTLARTSIKAVEQAAKKMEAINKLRKKAKKEPLSQSQVIALAIEELNIEAGV